MGVASGEILVGGVKLAPAVVGLQRQDGAAGEEQGRLSVGRGGGAAMTRA